MLVLTEGPIGMQRQLQVLSLPSWVVLQPPLRVPVEVLALAAAEAAGIEVQVATGGGQSASK